MISSCGNTMSPFGITYMCHPVFSVPHLQKRGRTQYFPNTPNANRPPLIFWLPHGCHMFWSQLEQFICVGLSYQRVNNRDLPVLQARGGKKSWWKVPDPSFFSNLNPKTFNQVSYSIFRYGVYLKAFANTRFEVILKAFYFFYLSLSVVWFVL